MYGYIGGKFIDGTRWTPDEGFVATERPWYTRAMERDGRIAVVDPYLDVHTGTVMMTIAKRLADGNSVVAMDLSLEKIQQIAERDVASGDSSFEIILDSRNTVVAHSDPQEIGRDYSGTDGTLWTRSVNRLRSAGVNVLEVEFEGEQYIIYAAKTESDWLCLSVKNATEVFRPLRRILGFTIAAMLLVVLTLTYIMARTNEQYKLTDRLNRQLSSISNIFVSMYDVDMERDRFTEIKSAHPYLSILAKRENVSARTMMERLALVTAKESALEDVLRFVDMDYLVKRLTRENTIGTEFPTTMGPWVRLRFIVARRDADRRPSRVLLLVEDIDKEKKERDALVDISERALAASEAKTAFLSNMSHEIRTPINAVLGMNEMILRECGDNQILAYAESIKTAGHSLLSIINDVLDFSKIEAGKLEILPVEYDLSSVLNDLVNMVQTRADSKGLSLVLDFDRDTPKRLYGDEVRLKQVITNILTNAVKYTEKGTVTFSVGFAPVGEDRNRVTLLVAVKDTGIGIKPEDMKKLFTEFERIEEKRNRNVEGTGLGMAITRNLLALMGTTLEVESTYGAGSDFHFRLEQKVVKWEPLGDYEASYRALLKEHQADREKFTAPEALVLVVDDNPMNLKVFQSLLKRTKIRIDTANDGEEGLLLAQDKKYDLIFLDHMMPKKDGIETLQELRAQTGGPNAAAPVVCLTANAISGAREQYIAAGFDDYLTKPIDAGKLEDVLLAYLPKEKIAAAGAEETGPAEGTAIPEILAPLSGQDWIDLSLGIRNSGSAEDYLPLLKIFYESLDEKADEIDGYYTAENWKDYTIKVHALKSSARLIGAASFGEEAQLLENAGKSDDTGYIRAHHEAFMAKCRSFKAPLSEVFPAEETDGEKPEADAELMEGVLEEIRLAAEDMDCDRLEAIFAEMEAYRIPEARSHLYGKLRDSANRFDYDAILALLSNE